MKKLSPFVLLLSAALLLPVASAMAEVVADPAEVIEVTQPAETVYKDGKKYTDGARVIQDAKDIIVLSPAAEVGGRGVVVIGSGYSSKLYDASALSSENATIQKIRGKDLVVLGNYNRFNIDRADGREQMMSNSVVLGSLNLLSRNIFDGSQEAAPQNQLVVGDHNKLYGNYVASFGFGNTLRNSSFVGPNGVGSHSLNFAMALGKNNVVMNDGFVMGYDNAVASQASLPDQPDSNRRYYTVLALGANNLVGKKNDAPISNITIGYSNIIDADSVATFGTQNDVRASDSLAVGHANKVKDKAFNNAALFGWNNRVQGRMSTTLGAQNVGGENALAAGYLNSALGLDSAAVGVRNNATARDSVAMGVMNNKVDLKSNRIIDRESGRSSAAMGVANVAGGYYSSALGARNEVAGSFSSAMGYDNRVSDARSSAFGYLNRNEGFASQVWGSKNTVSSESRYALSAGESNFSEGWQPLTFGYGNQNRGNANLVLGYRAFASGGENTVLGHHAAASDVSRGLALGNAVAVKVDDGVALGSFALAQRAGGERGYDQVTKAAAADNLLPLGGEAAQRRKAYDEAEAAYTAAVAHLQAKTVDFDRLSTADKKLHAEEMNQVQEATLEAEKNWHSARKSLAEAVGAWEATMPALALGSEEQGVTRQITGLAAGTQDTDAVNVAQLKRLSAQMQELTPSAWTPVAIDPQGQRHVGKAVGNDEFVFKGDRLKISLVESGKGLIFGLTDADKARLDKVDSHDDLINRWSKEGLPGGKDGKDGKDGVGVASAVVDEQGRLNVTLDDGRVIDAGQVRGADGVGIADVKVTDEGHLSVVLENNRVIDAGALPGGGFDAAPLHARMDRMESKIDATAARTAALGALMPIDFDEQRPTQFGFGLGWQGGTPAFALGLMHYSNRDTLWNAGAAFAGGRATLRAGATFRLGEKEEGEEGIVTTADVSLARQLQQALDRIQILEGQIEELNRRP